jgi:hypothetical protein
VELERPDRGVEPSAGVGREDEVAGRRADVLGEPQPRRLEQLGQPPLERQKLDRLPLELALEPLVGVEDRPRARAEGAVIQVHDLRVEEEQLPHAWRSSQASRALSLSATYVSEHGTDHGRRFSLITSATSSRLAKL